MFDIVDTGKKIRLFPLEGENSSPRRGRTEARQSIIDGGIAGSSGFAARWWPCLNPFDPLPDPDENLRRLRAKPR